MKQLRQWIGRIHRDERGAEGLEKLLIFAAVVLPLLALLIFFREEIGNWLTDQWSDVETDSSQQYDDYRNPSF